MLFILISSTNRDVTIVDNVVAMLVLSEELVRLQAAVLVSYHTFLYYANYIYMYTVCRQEV